MWDLFPGSPRRWFEEADEEDEVVELSKRLYVCGCCEGRVCVILPVSEWGKLFWFIFWMWMWCVWALMSEEEDVGVSVIVHASSFFKRSWDELGMEVVRDGGEVRRFWRWEGCADSGIEARLDWYFSSHRVSHLPAMKSGCDSMEYRIGMLV